MASSKKNDRGAKLQHTHRHTDRTICSHEYHTPGDVGIRMIDLFLCALLLSASPPDTCYTTYQSQTMTQRKHCKGSKTNDLHPRVSRRATRRNASVTRSSQLADPLRPAIHLMEFCNDGAEFVKATSPALPYPGRLASSQSWKILSRVSILFRQIGHRWAAAAQA